MTFKKSHKYLNIAVFDCNIGSSPFSCTDANLKIAGA
jgi:hypothetical protein